MRVIKPPPSERRGVDLNAIPKPRQSKSEGSLTTSAATDCISENDGDSARSNNGAAQQQQHQQNEGFKEGPVETQSSSGQQQQQQQKREDSASGSDTGNENQGDDKVALGVANIAAVADRAAEKEDDSDADSDDATGHDEAAKEREEEGTDEESSSPPSPSHQGIKAATVGAAGKVSGMFQRLLNLSPSQRERGVVVADLAGTNDDDKEKNVLGAAGSGRPPPPPLMPSTLTPRVGSSAAAAAVAESDSPPPPTIVRNGRLVCNLPDHAIHAGATAIVAVLVEHTLTVANAGDSRAVLCRDGTAFPLSYDHKPMSEIEHTRIQEAGGFVNQFGRVNGNLNLSRSIGDLKYKQDRGIAPAAQMITAEPDILQ